MFLRSDAIHADLGLLILRLGAGGIMLWQHGWPKLANFGDRLGSFADPIGLGPTVSLTLIVFAEVLCALLVVLGLWTRIALIPLIVGMSVIVFMHLGDDPFAKKELAVVFLITYIALLFTGSGRFSVDRISFR